MKYLIEHHETFYYRRKLHYQNICLTLKTKNKLEAKYILSIINSKIEVLREYMNFEEELEYIKNVIKQYIDIAKDEYSEFATKREHKYIYVKENGKKLFGSHPLALQNAIEDLTDGVHSPERETIAQSIVEDSNIKKEYKDALLKLSSEGKQRLRDEIIKAEIELLYYDKERNESRVNEDKIQPTYTNIRSNNQSLNTYSNAIELIKEIDKQEKNKYKIKTKYELHTEYVELIKEQKAHSLDKINLVIQTLFQSSDEEYLIDYNLIDYERFFQALVYTPKNVNQKKQLYNAYGDNIVLIAEDFKYSLDNDDEEIFSAFKYELKLQAAGNVDEKINNLIEFLNYCVTNDYLNKNYIQDNQKFSKKRYVKILKSAGDRKPFNAEEIQAMFQLMIADLDMMEFDATMFFIPLIAFYEGMRVEEICKLKTDDIKLIDGIWHFDINGDVKTSDSVRTIPIHKDLIDRFNFLDYVTSRSSEDFLFALNSIKSKATKKVKYSHYFLRSFTKSRDIFVSSERIENDLISFHSFRHFFATRLRKGKVKYLDISRLMGHHMDTVLKMFDEIETRMDGNDTGNYIDDNELDETKLIYLKEQVDKLYLEDMQEVLQKLEKKFKASVKKF
jgi:integrase